MRHHEPTTTVAILGADTMVGRALCALLEGYGYRTIPLDVCPTGVVDKLLDGAHLLLLVPRLDKVVREAFLGAIGKSAPQKGRMPVIALSTVVDEDQPVLWRGCRAYRGHARRRPSWKRIEAVLLDARATSATPTSQTGPG